MDKAFSLLRKGLIAGWGVAIASFMGKVPNEAVSSQAKKMAVTTAGAHVAELPLAFLKTRNHGRSKLEVFIKTMIFGFTWWASAKKK